MGSDVRATSFRPRKLIRRIIGPAFVSKPSRVSLPQDQMKTVHALWDTGATMSVVTAQLANTLRLISIGQMETTGVHGTKKVNSYLIDLRLPNDVTVMGLKVGEADAPNHDFDIIIGMDVITLGDFAVSNYQGQTVFSFRIPSQGHIDFVAEGKQPRSPIFPKKKISRNDPILVRRRIWRNQNG